MSEKPEKNLFKRGEIYYIRVWVNGRVRQQSLRTCNLAIAKSRRDKLIDDFKGAAFFGEERIPWKEAVRRWVSHEIDQIAPSTARRYATSLKMVEPFFQKYNIDKVDGKEIGRAHV